MPNLLLTSFLIYELIFLAAVLISFWWLRRRRRSKLPFDPQTERLLRSPGEGARLKIDALTDRIVEDCLAAILAPLGIFIAFALVVQWQKPQGSALVSLVILLPVLCLFVLGFFVHRISRRMLERTDWYLGQFGERNVADHLDALRQRGWRVFHDVPAENKGKKFNLDHVVVGPGGVFAIETKTPRRPEIVHSREVHVVHYNGVALQWPTGMIDYHKPRIAQYRADWLRQWLNEEGIPVQEVIPLLAIPWWYVRTTGSGPVQAVNPGQLAGIIGSHDRRISDQLAAAIAAKLEARCRDVAY
jgi:hypothetical protein